MIAQQTPAEEYREIAGRFTALVEGVPDERTWDRRSPVPEWTARDVVGHLVEWFPAFLAGGAGVALPEGPRVDEDPVAAWRTTSDAVQALLDDPATAGRTLSNPHLGELDVPTAVSRFFTADVFMHTWDLARATGQDETLDPERCAALLEGCSRSTTCCARAGSTGRGSRCPTTPTRRPGCSRSSAAIRSGQAATDELGREVGRGLRRVRVARPP